MRSSRHPDDVPVRGLPAESAENASSHLRDLSRPERGMNDEPKIEPLVATEEPTQPADYQKVAEIWNDFRIKEDSCFKEAVVMDATKFEAIIQKGKESYVAKDGGVVVGLALWHTNPVYTEYCGICANDQRTYYTLLREMVRSAMAAGNRTLMGDVHEKVSSERTWLTELRVIEFTPIGFTTNLDNDSEFVAVPALYRASCDLQILLDALNSALGE